MMKTLTLRCIIPAIFCFAGQASAQNITVGTMQPAGPYCAGATPTVNFTLDMAFGSPQTVNAELSDASGAFGSPMVIGSLNIGSAAVSGSVPVSIPAVGFGSAYAIRLKTTSVAPVTSLNSTSGFTINENVGPVSSIGGLIAPCQQSINVLYTASALNANIAFSISPAGAGTFIGNSITFNNGYSGAAVITATASGACGPNTSNTLSIFVRPFVGPVTLSGPATLCQNDANVSYNASAANYSNIVYSISPIGAGSFNGNLLTLTTGYSGAATVTATASGACGPNTTDSKLITVQPFAGPVSVIAGPATPCQQSSAVYSATAANGTITYSISPLNAGTFTGGTVTFTNGYSGAATITATAAGACGPSTTNSKPITIQPFVGSVSAITGAATPCQNDANIAYTATAANGTITYSISPVAAGSFSGNLLTLATGYSGAATITATASGACGPNTINALPITVRPFVGPVSAITGSTTPCQQAVNVAYSATAANATSIVYTISPTGAGTFTGNTITFTSGYSGAATITATASGLCGPATNNTLPINVRPFVGPVSAIVGPATPCQQAAGVAYSATAANATNIVYTISPVAAGIFTGNAITFANGYSSAATITATASGLCGPNTFNTLGISVKPSVGVLAFNSGTSNIRCAISGPITYQANALNADSIRYTLDAGSIGVGVTINAVTGLVTYVPSYTGPTAITAIAYGCNAPSPVTLTVTVRPTVGLPSFNAAAPASRCQGSTPVENYTATAPNADSVNYSISNPSAGTFSATTPGMFTYNAAFSGTVIITATAYGCNGPTSKTFTTIVAATVSKPVFDSGLSTSICQGSTTLVRSATVANGTITYSLVPADTSKAIIGSTNGVVSIKPSFSGSLIVKAVSMGCGNSKDSAFHTLNVTPYVGKPVFDSGLNTTICQGSTTLVRGATVSNGTLTYSLIPADTSKASIVGTNGFVFIRPSFSGGLIVKAVGMGCGSSKDSAVHTITVVQTPVITSVLPAFQNPCTGAKTSIIQYTSSVSNTTYTWATIKGQSASGTGTIGSFTAMNQKSTLDTTIFSITPSVIISTALSCTGLPATAAVVVKPVPRVDVIQAPFEVCDGKQLSGPINFTSPNAPLPVTYTWTNSDTSIGLRGSGSGNIVPFTAKNTGNTPVTASIRATPAYDGCLGADTPVATIIVKPTPRLTGLDSIKVCSGQLLNFTVGSSIPTTISPTTYTWKRPFVLGINNNTESAGMTGTVSEILSSSAHYYPLSVNYIFNLESNRCFDSGQVITVIVNPTPPALDSIIQKYPDKICSGVIALNFAAGRPPRRDSGEYFIWKSINASTPVTTKDNGQYALIGFPNPGTALVSITALLRNFPECASQPKTDTFSVNNTKLPSVSLVRLDDNLVCLAPGVKSYQWGYDVRETLEPALIPGATATQSYYIPNRQHIFNPALNYYWVKTTFSDDCVQKAYFNAPSLGISSGSTAQSASLNVYPNPAQDALNVEVRQSAATGSLEFLISDIAGKTLRRVSSSSDKIQIPVADLTPGCYIISCTHAGLHIATSRFIKN